MGNIYLKTEGPEHTDVPAAPGYCVLEREVRKDNKARLIERPIIAWRTAKQGRPRPVTTLGVMSEGCAVKTPAGEIVLRGRVRYSGVRAYHEERVRAQARALQPTLDRIEEVIAEEERDHVIEARREEEEKRGAKAAAAVLAEAKAGYTAREAIKRAMAKP